MNIGIIGIGAIGGTIAKKLVKAGHTVKVANSRGKDAAKDFAAEIGAVPSDLAEIGEGVDVLIISVPYGAIPALPGSVFDRLSENAIIVDTGNFYPEVRNEKIAGLGEGQTESLWLSRRIGRPVVKTFNNLVAYSLAELGKEKGAEGRLAMQVAGDDAEQKKVVMELVDACGFDPFDAGTLEDSWMMQPTAAGYCCDYTLEELKAVKEKSDQTPEAVAKRRTYVMTHFNELTGGDFSHENVIRMNRKINV